MASALTLVLEHWGIDLAFNKHLSSENASVETSKIKMHSEETILKPYCTACFRAEIAWVRNEVDTKEQWDGRCLRVGTSEVE